MLIARIVPLLITAALQAPAPSGDAPPPAPEPAAAPAAPAEQPAPAPAVTPAPAPVKPSGWTLELSTLKLLREKGVLSQEELDSAVKDLTSSTGYLAPDGTTLAAAKFALTVYGFAEMRVNWDSTQSFNEQEANTLVARPGTFAGTHDRIQFSARNSRLGFRLKAPEVAGIRASAVFEMDFLGTQLPVGAGQAYFGSESAYFTNPTFRARHLYLKVETPVVDLLAGQYWQLFGSQPFSQPNTTELQGMPAQIYGRTPQVRISKTLKTDPLNVELGVAMLRSPQRDSGTPDGQAGIRATLNKWVAWNTPSWTGSSAMPAGLGVSGALRSYRVSDFVEKPTSSQRVLGGGVAVDLLLPIIPGSKEKHGNALTLVAQYVWGTGLADQYGGLTGGVSFPSLPNPTGATPAPAWPQNVDNGLVALDANGVPTTVQWSNAYANLQYYLPVFDGRIWLSGTYARLWSNNTARLAAAAKSRSSLDVVVVGLFADPLPSVRLGLEYVLSLDHYNDGVTATNHRGTFSAAFVF